MKNPPSLYKYCKGLRDHDGALRTYSYIAPNPAEDMVLHSERGDLSLNRGEKWMTVQDGQTRFVMYVTDANFGINPVSPSPAAVASPT